MVSEFRPVGQQTIAVDKGDSNKVYATLLVNEMKLPGLYVVIWDSRTVSGNRVTSGLYFAVLEQFHQKTVSKLLLVT